MNNEKHISIKELADLKGSSPRAVRLAKSKYQTREVKVKGGSSFEILLSSIEPELQEKYLNKSTELTSTCTALIPIIKEKSLPTKANETALARLDLVREWQKFRRSQRFKTKADIEFIATYNTGLLYEKIFVTLGAVSIGTLERWKRKLGNTTDYRLLIPKHDYSTEFRTTLNDFEKQVFLKILLHPNKFSIGKAIMIAKHILLKPNASEILKQVQDDKLVSDITFRRYANWFKDNHFDIWTLARDGEKALKDNVEPFIKRDLSKIEVGEVLVADGHKLSFLIQNPFTGKATRATLIGFLDWKSSYLCGYEIMLEENTQCIASALRNSLITLGLAPKIIYQDNGRAFRAKYFTQTDFLESGFEGLYAKLGIKTVFAKPYNARAKVIERFFLEFQESFEKLMPTYSGSNIENKPAHFKRNEKFHTKYFKPNYTPTIAEVKNLINQWLECKHSQPCPNERDKSIKQVFNERPKSKIDLSQLDDLMMTAEIKTIYRNGIRFLNTFYWSDKLYGLKTQVVIKYSLFDLSEIKVFTTKNQFICNAKRVTATHPMAYHLGDINDMEDFKQKIQKQKKLKNKTLKAMEKFLPKEELRFLDCHPELVSGAEQSTTLSKSKNEKMLPSRDIFHENKFSERAVKQVQHDELRDKPFFLNNHEKFEFLMNTGCTDAEDRAWLRVYKESEEFKNLYET